MKNCETDYREPHHVMLVFNGNENTIPEKASVLSERCSYYQNLKEQGKVIMCGNFWNKDRTFLIVHIGSAAELEEIIDNDPGLKYEVVDLVRAMPFSLEESFQQAMQEQAYG